MPLGIHASYIHDDKRSASILLNSDMLKEIINKNDAKITIPITIPLSKLESNMSELSKAITNLQKVSSNYASGNIGDFLILFTSGDHYCMVNNVGVLLGIHSDPQG